MEKGLVYAMVDVSFQLVDHNMQVMSVRCE